MSDRRTWLRCRIFGHRWLMRATDPPSDKNYAECRRCHIACLFGALTFDGSKPQVEVLPLESGE